MHNKEKLYMLIRSPLKVEIPSKSIDSTQNF